MLCSDIDTMILILGVAPIGYLTGVSTDSSATEIAFFTLSSGMARQRQFRTRITWKVPMLGDAKVVQAIDCDQAQRAQVGFDAIQFARYLFKVYLKMFEYEDWSKTLTNASLTSIHRQIASPLAADLRYYTRLSLVKLIYLAKTSVVTEWRVCMDKLVDMIENDRTLLIGSSSLQELSQHMHTFGIWEHSPIAVPPRQLYKAPHYLPAPTAADEGLLGQPDVPSVVFVALIVPRSKLKVFTGGTPESVGTPGLHLSISHGMTCQNSFHSIQCFFGKLRARADSIGVCDVEEDATGWNGSSDLVVTCQVPLYTLLLGPRRAVRVSLAVNTNPSTFQSTRKLGPTHAVFEAGFADKERVWLLKAAPGAATHSDQTCRFSRNLAMPGVVTQNIHVGLNAASQATTLRIQTEFAAGSSEANALEQGANVTISADSACTLLLTITGCPAVRLKFLLPIHGENTKTRISRKSCWIEVTVPIASALTDGGYKKHPFPVIRDQTSIISWGLPRVGLEELPIIPISDRMDWVHTFVSMALSEQERNLNKAVNQNRSSPALLELKESIHSIFLAAVGQHPRCGMVRAFQLIRDDTMSCDTIILVSSVRDDYDAGTIFLDAYVIPLTNYRIRLMDSSLQAFVDSSPLSVKVSAQEEVFWKKLLPAAAERCRTWNHRGTCEYATSRNIPLSTKHSENPLCACGEAEMSEHFPNATKYYLFRKHATRIAIPVLFAVPYVESVIPQEFKHPAGARTHVLRNTSQATTSSVTPVEEGTPACNNCGALKLDLKTCNRCRKVWYCNHACQKADWKEHKKVCGKK
ncbi:hypothetical protein LTR39_001798 [Cryomyces antarcticus]|nr:hypothetical protein LTR39_001798 [Cryomyces antarcticus]